MLLFAFTVTMLLLDASDRAGAAPTETGPIKVSVDGRAKARGWVDAAGARILADYGSFSVYEVPNGALAGSLPEGVERHPEYDVVRMRRGQILTSTAARRVDLARFADTLPADDTLDLYVVQCVAPILDAWRDAAVSDGLEILASVPSNGLLVRGDAAALRRFTDRAFVQWCGPYGALERLDPEMDAPMAGDRAEVVAVSIEVVADAAGRALVDRVRRDSHGTPMPTSRVGRFLIARLALPVGVVAELLERPEVVDVEPWRTFEMQDERAGVIAAGQLDPSKSQPLGPGYLDWLHEKGFTGETFDFGIDLADSGLDRGVVDDPAMHPDFRAADGSSRISYAINFITGANPDPGDFYGHGTLNTSIAAGYNDGQGAPFVDGLGFHYGLGIAPFARIGSSKIFDTGVGISLDVTFTSIGTHAWRNGMRISSNSWGAPANTYTVESQEYDAMVRDADPETPGNQEYTILFAAGNASAGGKILTPGTAKNIITVGASENYRPDNIVDACGVGDSGADDADDIVTFSSGGPVGDGRIKPDIVAPGTHVQGCASQNRFYNGRALCVDASGREKYYPAGQTLYAWASGTSQATPVVAGAAALVRAYTVMNELLPDGAAPSPAMIKATLIAAATPLEGIYAGPTIPDARQGYGRVTLGPIFDDAARVLVDQSVRFGGTGETWVEEGKVGDPERPFRVVLAWTDAPGVPSVAPGVNDLDLEVRIGETVYRGNAYTGFVSTPNPEAGSDRLNTVEAVTIPAGVGGDFTVTVRAASIAGDGVPGNADPTDQDFAIVIYNVDDGRWTGPDPPVVTNVSVKPGSSKVKLLVTGTMMEAVTEVEINGTAVPADRIRYKEKKQALRIKATPAMLGLVAGENRLVVAVDGVRSEAFVFTYSP